MVLVAKTVLCGKIGNYLMDNVRCVGNETRLIDCKFDGWARHDCAEEEDAGVQCAQDTSPRAKITWNPLRLDYKQGELEKLEKVRLSLLLTPISFNCFKIHL